MAQKRAFVGAILMATGASEFFTQDVEDMQIGGNAEIIEVKEESKAEAKTEVKPDQTLTQTPAQPTSVSPSTPATEKPRFNKPQLMELKARPIFIRTFATSEDLIKELEKDYRLSQATKLEVADLWANTPDQTEEEKKAECGLPF